MKRIILAVAFIAICLSASVWAQVQLFDPPVSQTTQNYPNSVCAADLNGDGDKDLAVVVMGPNAVQIFDNNGDGTFTDQGYFIVGGANVVIAADLDNDNDEDLVVGTLGGDVAVNLNNGDGTFQPEVRYDADYQVTSVAAADFNGDGYNDLVAADNGFHNVLVFINNGNATFQEAVRYDVGSFPNWVVAADLDGDNDVDIATACVDNYISILLNDGSGTFTAGPNRSLSGAPASICGADFDGDNDIDLATGNFYAAVSVVLNNGDGTFQADDAYTIGTQPWSICAADFDMDGYPDLAVTSIDSSAVAVLLNSGDGTFGAAVNYAAGAVPMCAIAADLDADIDKDIVTANQTANNITILFNRSIDMSALQYLPGDANMRVGNWPPHVWGNDVTYIAAYFRHGGDYPCEFDGFYAAGDANGDCRVIGSDETRIFNYVRGYPGLEVSFCEDYWPAWLTENSLPDEAPSGWPECEPTLASDNIRLDGNVEIWIGNQDESPLNAYVGERLFVDAYIQTDADVYGGDLHIPLGTNNLYIDSMLSLSEGLFYDAVPYWQRHGFSYPFGSPPNPEGWSCQSLLAIADHFAYPYSPYIHWTEPTKIATFALKTVDNWDLAGQTVDCFDVGSIPSGWPLFCGDSTGSSDAGYNVIIHFSQVHFASYEELGFISGYVTDEEAAAIEGAYVTVEGTEFEDVTDEFGHFLIQGLLGGNYNVRVSHPQFCDRTMSVDVVEGETTSLDVTLDDAGTVAGVITDEDTDPIEGVIASVVGTNIVDTSDVAGNYSLGGICEGTWDIQFTHPEYFTYMASDVEVVANDTTELNISMSPLSTEDITLWFGGSFYNSNWSGTVNATPSQDFGVDVWYYGRPDIYVGHIIAVLGASENYVNGYNPDDCEFYYPFTEWDYAEFRDDYELEGIWNYSFWGIALVDYPASPWLHFEVPTRILKFVLEANDDSSLAGMTFCDALVAGTDFISGPSLAYDTLGAQRLSLADYYACLHFGNYPGRGTLIGLVVDPDNNPIEGVHVGLYDEGLASDLIADDVTGGDGRYVIQNIPVGTYSLSFSHESYIDTTISECVVSSGTATYDMTMWPPPGDDVVFWYGSLNSDPVELQIGAVGGIDIYIQTGEGVYGGNIHVPLGVDTQYFSGLVSETYGTLYYPLTEWQNIGFDSTYGSPPSPEGWLSQSLIGWANVHEPYDAPWLASLIPTRIARFAVEVINDESFVGTTVAGIDVGEHPTVGPLGIGDTLSGIYFSQIVNVSEVTFVSLPSGYAYIPGDANMVAGTWPPAVIGSDVTFLVNYFRGAPTSLACFLDGFYAAADANGDCRVIGGDVTKLVSYFRGMTTMEHCQDYPPLWLTPAECPEDPPPGWPNCE